MNIKACIKDFKFTNNQIEEKTNRIKMLRISIETAAIGSLNERVQNEAARNMEDVMMEIIELQDEVCKLQKKAVKLNDDISKCLYQRGLNINEIEVYIAREVFEMQYSEIAKRLKISERSAYYNMQAAIKRIKN